MEVRCIGAFYLIIILALACEMSSAAQFKDSKRRTKGKGLRNICDVTDRDSNVHCYCENAKEMRNATKAECWVFNGGIAKEDIVWPSFVSQPSLQTLSFNVRVDGALDYVPTSALQYLQNLRSLSIKYGNIVEVGPFALANLTNLTEVALTQSQIVTLHQYAFAHLPNLTTLNLEENTILEIGKDSFVDVPKLQKLILSKNNITEISNGAFQHTFNLLELDLNKNSIFHLDRHAFDGLANLRKLDLRKNRIYNLTEFTFTELWNLQELLLGKNEIKYISARAFDGLSQLQKLSLDDNKLAHIPPGLFEGVRGLKSLDLRSNELHALTFDNIKPILDNLKPQNSNLLLEGNNFVCNCQLKWIHLLRNETSSQNIKDSLDGVTCKMDPQIASSAYNKMSDNIKMNTKLETVEILKQDATNKKHIDDTKKGAKRNLLKIPPETLPCPEEKVETTEMPVLVDPVIPLQNEMKTYRLQEMSSARGTFVPSLLWSITFIFFFT